jgi:integration host factor subunit alpha
LSLGKKDIVKNITSKAHISSALGSKILQSFIRLISTKALNNHVKISNFGTFYYHKTPSRVGRNPKTNEEFPIHQRSKLSLKVSNNIKNLIN